MQLVERHVISRHDPRFAIIDAEAFHAKNLYNAALYLVRQAFIFEHRYLDYNQVQKQMQVHEAYKALPAKVAQQVLMLLDGNWKSYFEACNAYREDPSKFRGHPKLPKYKDKQKGRTLLVYTKQAISQKALKKHSLIQPSLLPIKIKTQQKHIQQVRIVPRHGFYVVEAVYKHEPQQTNVNEHIYAGIDIGLNNLATVTSNKVDFTPRIVNGRPIKSVNQYYNKRKAKLQSKLGKNGTTHHMERLTNKRTRRIDHYMHTASRRIIDLLVEEDIGTLVIGKNLFWKQEANLGKRNNQQFVQMPHARFIDMLSYKAQLVGIQVKVTEESYTSKASFLDGDVLPTYHPGAGKKDYAFSGIRVKRGLYRTANGHLINADVNGAYNIIRKVAPEAFEGVEGMVVHPVRIALTK